MINNHNKKPSRKIKSRFNRIKLQAEEKGISFSLTIEKLAEVLSQVCTYCDDELKDNHVNSLDVMDDANGYSDPNVISCCTFCRSLRNNSHLSFVETKKLITALVLLRKEQDDQGNLHRPLRQRLNNRKRRASFF